MRGASGRWPLRASLLALAAVMALVVFTAVAGARSHAQPQNTSQPTIQGTAVVGETLTVTNGAWSNSPTTFAYQWQRCDTNRNGCVNISGADEKSYKLV